MSENSSQLPGFLRIIVSTAVVVIATLAMLMVFDVIAMDAFTELTRKILLAGCVMALAGVALAFLGSRR